MIKSEEGKLAEMLLFDFGKQVLGKASGGTIVRLLKNGGILHARNVIKAAAEKSDPREYVGAVLRETAQALQITEAEFARLKAKYDAKVARSA